MAPEFSFLGLVLACVPCCLKEGPGWNSVFKDFLATDALGRPCLPWDRTEHVVRVAFDLTQNRSSSGQAWPLVHCAAYELRAALLLRQGTSTRLDVVSYAQGRAVVFSRKGQPFLGSPGRVAFGWKLSCSHDSSAHEFTFKVC